LAAIAVAQNLSPLALLRRRNFRLLWIGEAISLLGDQFYLIALPWLVLQLTGSALAMGTVLAPAHGSLRISVTQTTKVGSSPDASWVEMGVA